MQSKLYSSHVPSYVSIYNSLYSDIMDGVYPEGGVLPGEQQLAEKYNVSRNTLRQALAILSEDGLIIKSRGRGTVVAERTDKAITKRIFNPMTTLCTDMVDDVEVRYNYATPTDIARSRLGLSKSEILLASDLIYRAGGTVVGYSFVQIPTRVLSELDVSVAEDASIHELLNTKLYDAAVRQTLVIKLIFANEIEVEFLEVAEGKPLILIESILYHANHTPLARCKFYFLPEHYKLQYILQ